MAGHSKLRRGAGAHESRKHVGEPFPGAKALVVFARFRDAHLSGKMALLTDAVPLSRRKLRRIDHGRAGCDVIASRPVASLTCDTALAERR